MYCPKCGTKNEAINKKCSNCWEDLPVDTQQIDPTGGLDQLIPFKNSKALISYYLGIFSLIPFIGLVLAIPAIILGKIGLKFEAQHPEAKGKIHATVGIILGILVIIGNISLIYFIISFN